MGSLRAPFHFQSATISRITSSRIRIQSCWLRAPPAGIASIRSARACASASVNEAMRSRAACSLTLRDCRRSGTAVRSTNDWILVRSASPLAAAGFGADHFGAGEGLRSDARCKDEGPCTDCRKACCFHPKPPE